MSYSFKYTFLELLFSNHFQWVRKMSKMLWMKDPINGFMWVKFSDYEIERYKMVGIDLEHEEQFLVEDWR